MAAAKKTEIQYIDTDAALREFCDLLRGAEFIAVDTEFIRDKTYFQKLCLIQLCADNQLACIDPLTINHFDPLLELFRDTAITKVLHAAAQDMEVFLNTFDCLPTPVYDTQLAAALTGLGSQVSYAKLVGDMLDVKLGKSHARTDWGKRPLDAAQIRYAADDVRHLARLYPEQRAQLEQQDRLAWLENDFAALTQAGRYRPDPENAWRRIKKHMQLSQAELAILKSLAEYRERQAIKTNRPRGFILKDETLLEITKNKPQSIQDIERYRWHEHVIRKHGAALLNCVQQGLRQPPMVEPQNAVEPPLSRQQAVVADVLMALLKWQAHKHRVSVELIGTKKDITRLIQGKKDTSLFNGWRYELGGKVLVDFLDKKLSLTISNDQLEIKKHTGRISKSFFTRRFEKLCGKEKK